MGFLEVGKGFEEFFYMYGDVEGFNILYGRLQRPTNGFSGGFVGFWAKGVGFRGGFTTICILSFRRAWAVKGLAFEGLRLYKVVYGIKQEVC